MLWLCDSATTDSPYRLTTPACQTDPLDGRNGTVTGTLTVARSSRFCAATPARPTGTKSSRLIRGGMTYVNVHTAVLGAGEIRSQIGNGADTLGHQGGH